LLIEDDIDVESWFVDPRVERDRDQQRRMAENREREVQMRRDEQIARNLQALGMSKVVYAYHDRGRTC
jgi:hypothetical protein